MSVIAIIKAAFLALPEMLKLLNRLLDLFERQVKQQEAHIHFLKSKAEFDNAKERARIEGNSAEINRLLRNPPKF
jgi:hypothetical protein